MSYHLADGVLTNTFSKIEESTTRAFPQLVYTAGPIIQSATKIGDEPIGVCEMVGEAETKHGFVCL
jgi:hypothetical protein